MNGLGTLQYIMQQVFASYTQRLEESLKTIDLFSGAAKNRCGWFCA